MKPETITLVQESFQKVLPIADQAMVIFYDKLFEIDPELKKLFPQDPEAMGSQRNKLRDMLASAVAGLSNLDKLVPILKGLGERHVSYKVEVKDYDSVGAALIATLEAGLGDAFTSEVKDAWVEAYTTMASVMTESQVQAA
jgi:hemoglobin-like flavoprotein